MPELFEVTTLLGERAASGDASLEWAAYLYTTYVRDLVRDRPDGRPARSPDEVRAALEEMIAFYRVGPRPDVPGVRVGDLLGLGPDSYTKEEIEAAAREGRELPLR
jgi:hypothetical protein